MQQKSKKITPIAIISLFTLSMLSIFATVPLALAQPTLTLNLSSGPSGTIVTINGEGFTTYTYYRVYFDTNGNEAWKWGEPYRTVRADASGRFTTTLTIPSVPSGTYYIRADVHPYYPPAIASAPFTVITVFEKLLGIQEEISAIEAKLDVGGSFYTFVDTWFTTIQNAISNALNTIIAHISDLKNQLEAKLDYIIAKPDFVGSFSGNYTDDPNPNPVAEGFIAVNPVTGSGTVKINTTSISSTLEGYLVSDWSHYLALHKGALVTGRFNITLSSGDQIHVEINGIQREILVDNHYTGINHLTGTFTIITGTGAYKGATGSGTIVADIYTSAMLFTGSFDGIIKY